MLFSRFNTAFLSSAISGLGWQSRQSLETEMKVISEMRQVMVGLRGLAGTVVLVASTCYAIPGELVTKEYANHLHQVAKTSLENSKLNSVDLDLAIKSKSEKYYRETLEPRLDAAPIGLTEPSVDASDLELISACDDYAVALMNMGSAFFDAHDQQEARKWKIAAEKAANQCDCIVKNPATVQSIVDWRDVVDTSGTQKQLDVRQAKARRYLAVCSSI